MMALMTKITNLRQLELKMSMYLMKNYQNPIGQWNIQETEVNHGDTKVFWTL